jgi:hypothetical protein
MGQCFEISSLQSYEREVQVGVSAPFQRSSDMLFLPLAGEDAIDALLKPFDMNAFVFLLRLENNISRGIPYPWALIAFEKEYRLAGHFCRIRGDRTKLNFTAFSIMDSVPPADFVPPLSCIFVAEKQALAEAAQRSALLSSAWDLLRDRAEERHWLCIPDPPPEEWVRQNEQGDDDLFRQLVSSS